MANPADQRRLGVMQGRLSLPVDGRIQAFPWESWEREFRLAAAAGVDAIEFIVEADRWRENPLLSAVGREAVVRLCREHRVFVDTLCLDFLMAFPLWEESGEDRPSSLELLRSLIQVAPTLGVTVLNLPLLGRSEVRDDAARRLACEALCRVVPDLESSGLRIALETSLGPEPLHELLRRLDHPAFGVNYDTGNSAYFGHTLAAELAEYGHRIYSVHIKDCRRAHPSVRLGTGETDFESFFSALATLEYEGPIVLQSARTMPDPVEDVREQVRFVRQWLAKHPIGGRVTHG